MDEKRSREISAEATLGEVINNIGLLFEIFLCIPAISLIRFKLVSKSWLSLISEPEFGITHSHQNTIESPVSDLDYQDHEKDVSISLDHHSIVPSLKCLEPIQQHDLAYNKPKIVHSCKGLILLIQCRTLRPIVLNPTTQKYKLITPSFNPFYIDRKQCDLLLAFEPLKSHHYKIVMFLGHFCIHIFSSQRESWKEVSVTSSPVEENTRRIYWNGAIHCLHGNNIHMKFDLDTEKMIETPLPPKPKVFWFDKTIYFGESYSRLFLIQGRKLHTFGFRILAMDRDTLCWVIKHYVYLRPMAQQFPEALRESINYGFLISYVKSGDDKKSYSLVLAMPGKVVLFEVKKGKNTITDVVCELLNDFHSWGERNTSFHPYIQSLAPVYYINPYLM